MRVADAQILSQKYAVRQHEELIFASADGDKVSHMDSAGDLDNGKAWRAVRRPSDMVFIQTKVSTQYFTLTSLAE
jgi:hypothetical protein